MAPPAELNKVTLPTYRIEPPDILLIQGIRMAPKSPYFIGYQDILQIVAAGALPDQPIAATFQVDPAGRVDLGPSYGTVRVEGLTLDEASQAISQQLRLVLQNSDVSVTLIQPAGQQVISGEHLVAPDGTINLGVYGTTYISGMTVDEARAAIEDHLSEYFENPSVSVEVFGYQSKFYYVITEGPGDGVISLPVTGNETVLDAIARLGGLGQLSNKRIWISRPVPHGTGCDQVLPVDWMAITQGGNTATNYQLLPGDRVFVAADRFAMLDELVARVINPFERTFGFTLLGAQTIQSLQRFPAGTGF
jgi:protein involved in polysaccharide export with SLBB domain